MPYGIFLSEVVHMYLTYQLNGEVHQLLRGRVRESYCLHALFGCATSWKHLAGHCGIQGAGVPGSLVCSCQVLVGKKGHIPTLPQGKEDCG